MVFIAWGNGHHVIGSVGALDAQHIQIAILTHIPHSFSLFQPGIPDHCRAAAPLADTDSSLHPRIVDQAIGAGIQIDAVGLRSKRHRPGLLLVLVTVQLIDIRAAIETTASPPGPSLNVS